MRSSPLLATSALLLLVTGCPDDAEPQDDTTTDAPTAGGETETVTADGTGTDTSATGCEVTPGSWSAPEWDENAAEALVLREQLDALAGDSTMRGAETGAVVLDGVADLTAVWDGNPSLAAVANPGYVPIIESSFAEFVDVVAAGPQDLTDMDGNWMPGEAGGIWGDDSRGINEGGLEVRQLVDKGGYSAGILYAYALGLTAGEIEAATMDAIAAAWGNNPDLDPMGDLTDAAGYAFQMGFHADMATALTEAKAFAEDPMCELERDDALQRFFGLWEQSMMARAVFYGNRAETKLLAAADGTSFADVMHDLAEGAGVAAGFIGLPEPAAGPLVGSARIIDDAGVIQIMDAWGIDLDDLGASTTGLFVQSLPDLEAATAEIEGVVMDVYGLDAATIAGYAMPTPG